MSTKKHKATVLGAGSFGTAMANLLANQNMDVTLWGRDEKIIDTINKHQKNPKYLKNLPLRKFKATTNMDTALKDRDFLLFAIPCQFLRSCLENIKDKICKDAYLVNLAKGIEINQLKTPSQIFTDVLGKNILKRYAMISGPTFAQEIYEELPTGAVVASTNLKCATEIQQTMSTTFFRLYTVKDLLGVELAGALKNVMAIAVGIAEGLGYGLNARAGLMTRGLNEMIKLGVAMGAKERTFSGLSGVGDLFLTCTGNLSRNRQVGLKLGRGEKIEKIIHSTSQIAEGITTAKSLHSLMKKYHVEMPNAEHVYRIIYDGLSVKEAVRSLLSRNLKMEDA